MIPTQNFENYPEFANAGQKSLPNDAKYAAGFIPSDVLPAEWLNWFLNGATKGVTALNTGVKSIEQEINTVLGSRSVTPDINAAGQLLSVLNKIKAEAVLAAHPVGSLYWTSKNENPAITFGGGTWKQITDKFVLAAGSTYKAEATGGAATVTLTKENMPSHSHTFTPSGTISMDSHSHHFTPSGTVSSHAHFFIPKGTVSGFTLGVVARWRNRGDGDSGVSVTQVHSTGDFGGGGGMGGLYDKIKYNPDFNGTGTNTSLSTPTFKGTENNTSSTTSSGTFSGIAGTTSTSGSGTSFSILPPYVVKYCFERTA